SRSIIIHPTRANAARSKRCHKDSETDKHPDRRAFENAPFAGGSSAIAEPRSHACRGSGAKCTATADGNGGSRSSSTNQEALETTTDAGGRPACDPNGAEHLDRVSIGHSRVSAVIFAAAWTSRECKEPARRLYPEAAYADADTEEEKETRRRLRGVSAC